jgi:anti-sigma factor RsiW
MCYKSELHLMVLEKGSLECADIDELMGDLVDGELPITLATRVNDHIEGCEHCLESLAAYKWVMAQAKQLKPAPLPSDVSTRLRQALNQRLGLTLPIDSNGEDNL